MYIQNDIDTTKLIIDQHHRELRKQQEIESLLRLQREQMPSTTLARQVTGMLNGLYNRLLHREQATQASKSQQTYA